MRTTPHRNARRVAAAAIASALSLSALSLSPLMTSPASAATHSHSDGATATVSDVIAINGSIHIEGTGWKNAAGTGGSTIAFKLDAGATQPASGPVKNPFNDSEVSGIWAAVQANADGTFSVDLPFPTPTNTSPAIAADAWAEGTTHTINLLSGSLQTGLDTGRGVPVTVTVGGATTGTATTAADTKVTVAVSASGLTPGEVASVYEGDTRLQWSSGRPATLKDTITVGSNGNLSANVIFAAGTKPAGAYSLRIETDKPTFRTVDYVVKPSFVLSAGAVLGADGTLTIGNVAPGATISSVTIGSLVLASNLTADGTGTATAPYSLDKSSLGTHDVVITVDGTRYTLSQKVSPDETPFGTSLFDVTSTETGDVFQGLYQSAYSATENALYAAAASGTGAAEDGYLYKLDPDTLEVLASVHPKEVTDADNEPGQAPYGIAVDDTNGTVWITNTRTAGVAVYDAGDLTLLKQYPANTLSHGRDAYYDAATNQVFVSSASEGTSGKGSIMVFEGGDNDGDGIKFEIIKNIDTGYRVDFSPMSLDGANGYVYSPSLQSNKVAKVNTTTLDVSFITVSGINVGGRGASGLAVNPANNQLLIASQNADEVVIADGTTGATIREIPTGAGALNVKIDPVKKVAYVSNFNGTSVTVLDLDGNKVAALPIAKANHVSVDGKGNAYAVDKAAGNKVWKISPTFASLSLASAVPTISGSATVGKFLTAKPGTWTTGTALAYQWKRNGAPIAGATKATYHVLGSDAGASISVTVTGSKAGYATKAQTSAGVKIALPAKPLTAAEKKVQAAQKKVDAAQAKIATVKSQIKKAKKSNLSKKAKAKKVKALNKKLSSAKKSLTKQKKALTKAKAALKKATKKK